MFENTLAMLANSPEAARAGLAPTQQPGFGGSTLGQITGGLNEIATSLAAGFAKDPRKRAYYQEQQAQRAKQNQDARVAAMNASLERMKVYGQVFASAGGPEKINSLMPAFEQETRNLASAMGGLYGPERGQEQAALWRNTILAQSMMKQGGDPFTLSPGQTRFDASGRQVASIPAEAPKRITEEHPLPNGMIQPVESFDGGKTFRPIPGTVPFDRRDPAIVVQGVDEQNRPITTIYPRAAIQQALQGGTPARAGGTPEPLNVGPKQPLKPLPEATLSNLQQSTQALKALGQIEKNLSAGGVVMGPARQLLGKAGLDKKATDFDTARNNFKLSAQAMIKGVPSNFDVESVIATLPDIGAADQVNRSRMAFAKSVFGDIVRGTLSYYKGQGYALPAYIINQAKELGVDVTKIPEWNGQDDPLQGAIDKVKRGVGQGQPGGEGGGTTPPQGSVYKGLYEGKPVWETPDGRHWTP